MKKDRRTKVLEDTKHCWAHNDKISDKKQRNWEEIYGYKLDEWLDVSVWDGDTVMPAEVAETYKGTTLAMQDEWRTFLGVA